MNERQLTTLQKFLQSAFVTLVCLMVLLGVWALAYMAGGFNQ